MKKNFDDFLKTFTDSEFEEISDQVNEVLKNASLENLDEIGTNLGTQVAIVSSNVTFEILARYHEWLHS